MSKAYLDDIKVKCGEGEDGVWFVWLESGPFGTILAEGESQAAAIAELINGIADLVEKTMEAERP
jgi:hypothetical protein